VGLIVCNFASSFRLRTGTTLPSVARDNESAKWGSMSTDRATAKILVFDVGGSHAAAALAQDGGLQGKCSLALDSEGTAETIMRALESLGKKVLTECGSEGAPLSGASFGFPNPFDYNQGISYMQHKYSSLYGLHLRTELARTFATSPQTITFVNDASAFLLGEIEFGAAAGCDRVVGITLGTGLGSAFAVGGHIVTSGEGVPDGGFLWNVPYKEGIVEDYVSTRAIRRVFREISSKDIEVREIALRASTDAEAMMAMRRFGEALGTVLWVACSGFRPDTIVLGGAISRSANLFLPAAQKPLDTTGIRLRTSQLFDDAALLGAAVAWHRK
jgi:glucokinase